MCGIMSYIAFKEPPDKKIIKQIFINLENRGDDASGFAYTENNELVIAKSNIASSEFVKKSKFKKLKLPQIFIAHTRAATQGVPENNQNNHPIFNKKGLALVHNGIIRNDSEVFAQHGMERDAEVDSEVILALISKYPTIREGIKECFKQLSGSFAICLIDKNQPNMLYIARKQSPVYISIDRANDFIMFTSGTSYVTSSGTIHKLSTHYRSIEMPLFFTTELKDNAVAELDLNSGLTFSDNYSELIPKDTYDAWGYDNRSRYTPFTPFTQNAEFTRRGVYSGEQTDMFKGSAKTENYETDIAKWHRCPMCANYFTTDDYKELLGIDLKQFPVAAYNYKSPYLNNQCLCPDCFIEHAAPDESLHMSS